MNIYQIELTNDCNLKCTYCPRTDHMTRIVQSMSTETLDRVCDIITSTTVRLHHYGESLLDIRILLYAIERLTNKGIRVEINTNGLLLYPDVADQLIKAGLAHIYVSYHVPKSIKYLPDIDLVHRDKIEVLFIGVDVPEAVTELKTLGYTVTLKTLRDLGQVDLSVDRDTVPACAFLDNKEVVVTCEGYVVTCCEVYDNEQEEILGTVFDDPVVVNAKQKPITKCLTCAGYGNDKFETEKTEILN